MGCSSLDKTHCAGKGRDSSQWSCYPDVWTHGSGKSQCEWLSIPYLCTAPPKHTADKLYSIDEDTCDAHFRRLVSSSADMAFAVEFLNASDTIGRVIIGVELLLSCVCTHDILRRFADFSSRMTWRIRAVLKEARKHLISIGIETRSHVTFTRHRNPVTSRLLRSRHQAGAVSGFG